MQFVNHDTAPNDFWLEIWIFYCSGQKDGTKHSGSHYWYDFNQKYTVKKKSGHDFCLPKKDIKNSIHVRHTQYE